MSVSANRQQRRALEAENERWPNRLKDWPRADWPLAVINLPHPPVKVMRSKRFLVQIFEEPASVLRLTVCRTAVSAAGEWHASIEWDELQRLKSEVGYADRDAVEVFPADRDVVNVANMRHLWVLPEKLSFAWRKS